MKHHTLKWFHRRIGKKIYRAATPCNCPSCYEVEKNGLLVGDNFHAEYLFNMQNDYPVEYFDKPLK